MKSGQNWLTWAVITAKTGVITAKAARSVLQNTAHAALMAFSPLYRTGIMRRCSTKPAASGVVLAGGLADVEEGSFGRVLRSWTPLPTGGFAQGGYGGAAGIGALQSIQARFCHPGGKSLLSSSPLKRSPSVKIFFRKLGRGGGWLRPVWWTVKCFCGFGTVYDGSICWFSDHFFDVHDYTLKKGGHGNPKHFAHYTCSHCHKRFCI